MFLRNCDKSGCLREALWCVEGWHYDLWRCSYLTCEEDKNYFVDFVEKSQLNDARVRSLQVTTNYNY